MKSWYEQYRELMLDGSWIGLEAPNPNDAGPYFCTPVGAQIIGWDNGIHYCFLDGFGQMVFCVNPEPCGEQYVYPLARDFRDFLRLILAVRNTNPLQQMIGWDKAQYLEFLCSEQALDEDSSKQASAVLKALSDQLGLTPMEQPFEYVKKIQQEFPYQNIVYSNEYYDTLGLSRPDGSEPDAENGAEFAAVSFELTKE